MKNKQLHMILAAALLFFLVSLAIAAQATPGRDPQTDADRMRAEDYPLGDIRMDEATFQKFYRAYPERMLKALPASYDARSEGIVSAPKNQGNCGSCWAFATTGAMESHIKRTYPAAPLYDLSEQQQVSCNTSMYGCSGGMATAILFWENKGPNSEADYPYASGGGTVPACIPGYAENEYRVANFYSTSGTENFKASLYDKGPSYWRYTVHADFQSYWNGSETKAYVNATNNVQGGHAVLIIGWDDNKDAVGGGRGAFLCKNSWGASGGPNHDGTFWIAYSGHANDLGFGMCNFDVYDNTLPPTLTVISPNGGESWFANDLNTISWTSTGTVGNVRIDYSTDGGANWLPVTGDTANDGSHDWTVPDSPSASCLVRVGKADGGDPTDASDSVFSILPGVAPFIAVTSPAGGAQWERDQKVAITWLRHGPQNANVKILLYKGTSTLVRTITSSTPNDGLIGWRVPVDLALGSTYFIRVQTVDNLIKDDSDAFSVIVPAITVTAPAAGAAWVKNAVHTIAWNKLGTQDANVKIQLFKDTIKKLDIATATPNNGSFDWATPSTLINGTYTIRITTLDGKVKGTSKGFAIARGIIRVTAPSAGTIWQRGVAHTIAWTGEGTLNASVKVQLYQGTALLKTIAANTPNDGSFDWTIPATQALAANYKVRVTTVDNLVQASSGAFAIAKTAGLTLTAPNGDQTLKAAEPYTIRWSEAPDVLEVKLEFSRDNGGTFTTIADHVPDTGSYDWPVPVNFTRNGIVRVSDAAGKLWQDDGVLEFSFLFNCAGEGGGPAAAVWFGADDPRAPSYGFGRIDIGGNTIGFGGIRKVIGALTGKRHELKVRLDPRRDTAGIWLDGQALFADAPLGTTREHYFEPGLVLDAGGEQPVEMVLDDLAIRVVRRDAAGEDGDPFSVLKDDFERYDGKANPLEGCWQWRGTGKTGSRVELDAADPANKSLRLHAEAGKPVRLRLPFSLPARIPFDISDGRFTVAQ